MERLIGHELQSAYPPPEKIVDYWGAYGPALEKVAQEEGKKQFGAEAVWISDAEFARFRRASLSLWDEWGSKSEYCSQLVQLVKDMVKK